MQARPLAAALIATLIAGTAAADPVDVKTAQDMLFAAKGAETVMRQDTGLSPLEVKTLEIMFKQKQFLDTMSYYGAIAISPGDGLVAEPTTMSKNLHSPQAAEEAALKGCNAKKTAEPACIIVADVLPKKWQNVPLMLNQDATAGFREFRRGGGPKAIAISPATGVWSSAKGPNAGLAAMNDCLNKAQPLGSTDCEVVVEDK